MGWKGSTQAAPSVFPHERNNKSSFNYVGSWTREWGGGIIKSRIAQVELIARVGEIATLHLFIYLFGLHLWHTEVPGPGVEPMPLEPQQ